MHQPIAWSLDPRGKERGVVKTLPLLLLVCLTAQTAVAAPAQILLLRHGEKPDSGDELSPKGWERAKALPALLAREEFAKYGPPVALFGMSPTKHRGAVRAIQTLKYLSEHLGVPIDQRFRRGEEKKLAHSLMEDPRYEGKLVVVCWEHRELSDILRALGMPDPPRYRGSRFDRAWLVKIDGGKVAGFQDLPQTLLPGDGEK